MWFLQQSTPNSGVYNQSFAFKIQGDLEVETLRRCLHVLEKRHESLRTTFVWTADQLEQQVQPASEFSLTLDDLNALPPMEREDRLQAIASEEASRLFDLTRVRCGGAGWLG